MVNMSSACVVIGPSHLCDVTFFLAVADYMQYKLQIDTINGAIYLP